MKWVRLSTEWGLGDTRSVMTFIINILCVGGIWVIGYSRWRFHARRVSDSSSVKVLDLLSVHGLGEASDAISVVGWTALSIKHASLIAQCLMVLSLSIVGVLAGPVAQHSTRLGSAVIPMETDGLLAESGFNGTAILGFQDVVLAQDKWSAALSSLNTARFPQDQLLDFLPDVNTKWMYNPEEWNSTWTMACEYTPRTQFEANATGDMLADGLSMENIPAIRTLFPKEMRDIGPSLRLDSYWVAYYDNSQIYRDVLAFYTLMSNPSTGAKDFGRMEANNDTMRVVILAVHLHNAPRSKSTMSVGTGLIEAAFHTKADCKIERKIGEKLIPKNDIAYLWINHTDYITQAYANYHHSAFMEQSIANAPVNLPSGPELTQFFQVYFITKDTQEKHRIRRTMSVSKETVELAALTLALFVIYVLTLLAILVWTGVYYRTKDGLHIPRTKVDWVLQSIREVSGRESDLAKFEASANELRVDARKLMYGPVTCKAGKVHIGVVPEDSPTSTPVELKNRSSTW